MYVFILVFSFNTKLKQSTTWSVMLLFCSAPLAAWVATVFPEPSMVWKVLAPASCLLHCALFLLGTIFSYWEFKTPSEVTQKYITGPDDQKFTEYADPEVGGALRPGRLHPTHSSFDLQGVTSQQHEVRATKVRDVARGAVRSTMLLAAMVWVFVFIADLRDSLRPITIIEIPQSALNKVQVQWDSDTVWPQNFVFAGGVGFAANEYQVFRIDFVDHVSEGHASLLDCPLDSTILSITAECSSQICQPLVLLAAKEGLPTRVVNCATQQQYQLDAAAATARPSHIALQADSQLTRPKNGPMLAVVGDDAVEYSSYNWEPQGMMLQVKGSSLQNMDWMGNRLYLFERDSSVVNILDMDDESSSYLASLGRWSLPPGYSRLVAGSAAGLNTLYLLEEGAAPSLWRWSPPV
jgi:hypothetical protein